MDIVRDNIGFILAALGIAFAIILSGIGSAKGGSMIGKAAAALISEQPEKFGQSLVLQLMSASQGLYGFIIGFLIFSNINVGMGFDVGFKLFIAGLIMGVSGYFTAIEQSVAATAGIQILAKKPEHSTKGVLYSAMIETYAIFAFVVSILIILST